MCLHRNEEGISTLWLKDMELIVAIIRKVFAPILYIKTFPIYMWQNATRSSKEKGGSRTHNAFSSIATTDNFKSRAKDRVFSGVIAIYPAPVELNHCITVIG